MELAATFGSSKAADSEEGDMSVAAVTAMAAAAAAPPKKKAGKKRLRPAERREVVQRAAGVVFAGLNGHVGRWVPQEQPEGPAGEGYGGALLVSQLGTLRVRDYAPKKPKGVQQQQQQQQQQQVGNETDGSIQMHCDANSCCDVVTMLLLQQPASGGKARVCSAARVHNELLKRDVSPMERCIEPIDI